MIESETNKENNYLRHTGIRILFVSNPRIQYKRRTLLERVAVG